MNKGDLILVTGATGQQGGAVARALLSAGHKVRAMSRNPEGEKARALAGLGAEVVRGDLDDAGSLERAVKGAWGVFAVQDTWEAGVENEEEQGKRIAWVARELGVQHFVYTSGASAHRKTGIPHFDNKWRVEETVRGLGFPSYVIIRPVFFMENLLSSWFKPGIDDGMLQVSIRPDTTLQMIAVADIGEYGRLAFERHDDMSGEAIDIAGDALTMPATAKIISKNRGRAVTFEQVPIEQVRAFSEDFAIMLEWFDRVGFDADIATNAERFGIRPTSFVNWASTADWS